MRGASFTRGLKPTEINLAKDVFHGALPPWSQIGITDGLGVDDTVWTMTRAMIPGGGLVSSPIKYYINFGDAAQTDLSTTSVSLGRFVPGYYEQMCDVFMHEMTHVWQYSRPYVSDAEVAAACIYAQNIGAGYKFKPGDPWASYNLEQQASIVETWNNGGRKEDDELFPYIHYIIRKEGMYSNSGGDRSVMGLVYSEYWFADIADLAQLKMLLEAERMPVTVDEPVRVTTKDNSFVVVLTSDVLFDFNKADLKPAADRPLEQAWAKIQTNPNRRSVLINGHTDGVGDDGYNMHLSEKRAEAVAQWFYKRGYLTPSVAKPQGFGKTNPAMPNTTAANRAKNRRVEIYVINN